MIKQINNYIFAKTVIIIMNILKFIVIMITISLIIFINICPKKQRKRKNITKKGRKNQRKEKKEFKN